MRVENQVNSFHLSDPYGYSYAEKARQRQEVYRLGWPVATCLPDNMPIFLR